MRFSPFSPPVSNSATGSYAQSIGLTSVANARQLGGYPTRDGKTVKQGLLLRTASLTGISPQDIKRLTEDYHLAAAIDLRASFEVAQQPEPVLPGVRQYHIRIMAEDMKHERSRKFRSVTVATEQTPAQKLMDILASGIISDRMYVEYLQSDVGAAGFRDFFRVLLEAPEDGAVLWHCTSGKDRTGVAAMLLLGVLNVDEKIILEDYLLTNQFFEADICALRKKLEPSVPDKVLLEELLVVGRGVLAPYMQNLLDYIREQFGDIPGCAKTLLGLSDGDIALLRARYTV